MSILVLAWGVDWQGAVVLLVVVTALSYLLLRGRFGKKKGSACGSGACGCVKKKS